MLCSRGKFFFADLDYWSDHHEVAGRHECCRLCKDAGIKALIQDPQKTNTRMRNRALIFGFVPIDVRIWPSAALCQQSIDENAAG